MAYRHAFRIHAEMLEEYMQEFPERIDTCTKIRYGHYIERCKKIRKLLEGQSGYDRDAAVEKCRRRNRDRREDDIGGDALMLAARRRGETKRQEMPAGNGN